MPDFELPRRFTMTGARPFAGWTLAEARERCIDLALVEAHADAQSAWAAAGSSTHFVYRSRRIRGGDNAKSRHDHLLYQRRRDTFRNGQRALHKLLVEGRLLAWGRRESPLNEPASIPASAWNDLLVLNSRRSLARELTPAKLRIHDIRIYPVVEAPDAVERLAGMGLADAFHRFILDDPEVTRLRQSFDVSDNRPGWSPLTCGHLWPLAYTWRSGEAVAAGGVPPLDPPVRSPERAAYGAILKRLYRLLQLLSDGSLVATGIPASPALDPCVPPSVWTHCAYFLDGESGDILEENAGPEGPLPGSPIPRWRALVLKPATISTSIGEKPKSAWVALGALTAGERSVFEIVRVHFPNGTANIRPGDRNRRIVEELKRAGNGTVGESTIKRCFAKIAFRPEKIGFEPE